MFLETFFDLLLRKISLMYNLKTEAVLAGAQWFMSGWSATVYVQLERDGICPAGAQRYMSGWSAMVYVRLERNGICPAFAYEYLAQ